MRRALISVYDKAGVADFARGLAELGWRARRQRRHGAAHLAGARCRVKPVEEPDRLRRAARAPGRHAPPRGTRAASSRGATCPSDVADLEAHGIEPFDLVCVNLYPFEGRARTSGTCVETIDIGGPSLLRGAAKNFAHVAAGLPAVAVRRRCWPSSSGKASLSLETRRTLAAEAFSTTAAYETSIACWFQAGRRAARAADALAPEGGRSRLRREPAPARSVTTRERRRTAVGRATARQAALLQQPERPVGGAGAARRAERPGLRDRQARQPLRGGSRDDDRRRPRRALAADPVSAYGGVVALNRPVRAALGAAARRAIRRGAVRAAVSRRTALEHSRPSRMSRILATATPRPEPWPTCDVKRVLGGFSCRSGTPASTSAPIDAGGLRRAVRGRLGRPPVRLDGLQARRLERDRASRAVGRRSGSARVR